MYRLALLTALAALSLPGCGVSQAGPNRSAGKQELLNVSYDPTRELWKAINRRFAARYQEQTGV